jgi:hypothetical protein
MLQYCSKYVWRLLSCTNIRTTRVPSYCVRGTQRLVTARIKFFVLMTMRSGKEDTVRTHVFIHSEFQLRFCNVAFLTPSFILFYIILFCYSWYCSKKIGTFTESCPFVTSCLFLLPGCRPEWYAKSINVKVEIRGVQIPCNRSPERLNFVQWRLVFVGHKCGNYFVLLRCLEFWGGSWIFRKYVYPLLRYCIKQGHNCFLPYNHNILIIHYSLFIQFKCMWPLHLIQRY